MSFCDEGVPLVSLKDLSGPVPAHFVERNIVKANKLNILLGDSFYA